MSTGPTTRHVATIGNELTGAVADAVAAEQHMIHLQAAADKARDEYTMAAAKRRQLWAELQDAMERDAKEKLK